MLILTAAVLLLPDIVSTKWFSSFLETRISNAVKRLVRIENLKWKWSEGVLIQGFSIADDPDFSHQPMLSVISAKLDVNIQFFGNKCLFLNFMSEGANLRLIRDRKGESNLEKFLSNVSSGKDEQKEKSQILLFLPIDIQSKIDINDFSFLAEDRLREKQLALKNASLHLDMPSLYSEAIMLTLLSDAELDGKNRSPIRLKAMIRNLFDAQGALNLNGIYGEINAAIPGVQLDICCDLSAREIKSDISLDLEPLSDILKHFLPAPMSDNELSGKVNFIAETGNPLQAFDFDMRLEGFGVRVSGDLLKGEHLGPVNFKIANKGDFDSGKEKLSVEAGEIHLDNSRLIWSGTASGILHGAPDSVDIKINPLEINLEEFLTSMRAVMPRLISGSEIKGNLKLRGETSGNFLKAFSFDANLEGDKVSISGDLLKGKHLDTFNFKLSDKGVFDSDKGKLSVEAGEIHIGNSRFVYNGVLDSLHDSPAINLNLSRLRFDLGELLNAASDFLPEKFPLTFNSKDKKFSPILEARDAVFSGPLSAGANLAEINGLSLDIPDFQFNSDKLKLSGSEIKLLIPHVKTTLRKFFPESAELSASLNSDSLNIKGEKEIAVRDLKISNLSFKSEQIRKSETAMFGIVSRFSLQESLAVAEFNMPSLFGVTGLRHSLTAECALSNTDAEVTLRELKIFAPVLAIEKKKSSSLKTSLELDTRINSATLRCLSPLKLDISGARSRVIVGVPGESRKLVSLEIQADAKDTGKTLLNTKGNLSTSLDMLSKNFPSLFLPHIEKSDLKGDAEFGWNFSGRLPNEKEINKLSTFSTTDIEQNLSFLEQLDIFTQMKAVEADVKLGKQKRVKIKSLSTSPMRYSFDRKSGNGKLSGEISAEGIEEIPSQKLEKPLSLYLSFSANHHYFQSLLISQSAEIKPSDIKANLDVSFYGIDKMLQKGLDSPLSLWHNNLGGKIRAVVSVPNTANVSLFLPGLDIKGGADADAEAESVPGKSISAKARINVSDADFRAGNAFTMKGLNADVHIGKHYKILKEQNPNAEPKDGYEKKVRPLSAEVMEASPQKPFISGVGAVQNFISKTQKRVNMSHTFSFTSARIGARQPQFEIGQTVTDLDLSRELPGLDYFRIDLLGGSVTGSVLTWEKSGAGSEPLYFVKLRLSFSGLDMEKIFPDMTYKAGDAEVSGQLSLSFPLRTELKPLLQETQLDIQFTHIGHRAVERMLYALDPYESNEAIVSQRELFRKGMPRRIAIAVKDGNLSLSGEIEAKGILLEIPRLERLNIANISGIDKLGEYLIHLKTIAETLKITSANTLRIGEDGTITMDKN
ncbi:MAG: hypothetical protein BWK80_01365 [Desulfobacteraceae bacterium IS3]|nr:MAG: hypothetical protein BWK80_01365 [Desulfobacteraceae bacterium IS3]